MSNTPMTAPPTGVDAEASGQVWSWLRRTYHRTGHESSVTTPRFDAEASTKTDELMDELLREGFVIVPATAVPDAELRASIRDVKEVAMDASREHGFDLSQPLARIDAWLAHGGRDGNG